MKPILKIFTVLVLAVTITFSGFHRDANAYQLKGPNTQRLTQNQVGRGQNAGIIDVQVVLDTGVEFTQHFHCNGWNEEARTFDSLTGTFFNFQQDGVPEQGNNRYHFTIEENGQGAWVELFPPPYNTSMALQIRTEDKLHALIDE